VRFLGNLIAGVKGGILKFKDNFVDHLRKGLLGWLFGALAEGGVEIPDKFDLKGVVKLLASIFGLTWTNIRNRLVKQIGEKAMAAAEQGVEIFQLIRTEGVGGLWQKLLEKIGDIKEMILEQVKDFVVTKIIVAGITWLISLLNPAAAFIKACKLIYDVVMFFVNNIERIGKFVNSIIDSVADMVRGNVSAVVNKIEDVLGQMVPIIIGFLASVLGLGGIGEKIRSIVQKLQKPVNKALDLVIKTGLKLAGPIIRGIKGISGRVKAKVAAGKAWVKAKVRGGDDTPEGRQQRLVKGVRSGVAAANRFAGKPVGQHVLKPVLGAYRTRFGLSVLEPVKQGGYWAIHGVVSRMTEQTQVEVAADAERLAEARQLRQTASNERASTKSALKPLSRKLRDPKSSLKAEQKARGQAAETEFNTLDAQYDGRRDRLDEMLKSKKELPQELNGLITFFTDAAATFARIRRDIDFATADSARIQQEANTLRGEIEGQDVRADAVVADVDVVRHVLNNPAQKVLAARIDARRKAIKAGLAALTGPIEDLAGLDRIRTLKDTASGLQTDLFEANRIKHLIVQVREQGDVIDKIIRQTTIAGRPGATIGGGSSEEAVAYELANRRQVGDAWHGPKCTDDARGLTNAIATLQTLAALPTAAPVQGDINAAIQRAQARLPGLQAGSQSWEAWAASNPGIWPDGSRRGGA
jgi:hypothetical protein